MILCFIGSWDVCNFFKTLWKFPFNHPKYASFFEVGCYKEICARFELDPAKCLMIGNNAQEDMEAAAAAGIKGFLVKDCLICEGELPDCPQGTFEDMVQFLAEL